MSPCDININQFEFKDSKKLDNPTLYRAIVGSLIYIMCSSRCDLAYIVTKLSQYMSEPTHAHLNIAKNVLKYLKGTKNYQIKFNRCKCSLNIFGYCDSDYAADSDRKSTSGYCFQLCNDGPLISWKSKKQNVVSLSSCEAEYNSLTYAIQEGKFLVQLFSDMCNAEKTSFDLFVDNRAAILLAKNPVYHQRSKHISVKYHFARDEVQKNNVQLLYVPTDQNIGDIFTKPTSRPKLLKFNIFGK